MTPEGLRRADEVRINRMLRDYSMDQLPHHEQSRADVNWLLAVVIRLSEEVQALMKEQA